MSVTNSQFAAFVDRVIACREAEDRAKEDTKQVYAEIAEAGEDKAAIGVIVREQRLTAKEKAKADFRNAAVDDARERYRRGKASHVRVREGKSSLAANEIVSLDGGSLNPSAGMGGEADRQLISSPVNDSGQGEADGAFRPGNRHSVPSADVSPAHIEGSRTSRGTDVGVGGGAVSVSPAADARDLGGVASSSKPTQVAPPNVAHGQPPETVA